MNGMHLNMSLLTPGHFRTAWRLDHADPLAYLDIDHFVRLARIAEAATIDAVFLGDTPALSGAIARSPDTGLDPLILLTAVATATTGLGVIATSSSTYNSPYNLARHFNALDHVTKGRAGVNIVTTGNSSAAANFGLASHPDKQTRYRRAHEFLDVVTRLWDSWGSEVIEADKLSGRYADPSAIRELNHSGEFFSVKGPLPVPAGPQGRPLIVQAGGSDAGLDLAAAFADVVFTAASTPAEAARVRTDIRRRAAERGRNRDSVTTSLGVVVLIAATDAEAKHRELELQQTLPVDDLTATMLATLGLRPNAFAPDDLITADDLPPLNPDGVFSAGFAAALRAQVLQEPRTPRQLVYGSAGGSGHRMVVGSAERIADDLERWFRAGAADGFTIMPADTAVDYAHFTEHVVPILKQRKLFHQEYPSKTLRGRYR
jgi:FMN-dependent oxidoreductase (nitrilotriacetate monooxygenase family)